MNRIALFVSLLILVLVSLQSLRGQNRLHPWGIGTGAGVADFQNYANGIADFQPIFHLSVSRFLSGAFEFTTRASFAPRINYPGGEYASDAEMPSMLDLSYTLKFKLNNGAFLKETAFIGPYGTFGIGGNNLSGTRSDVYVPLGGGLAIRLGPRIILKGETTVKLSVNSDFKHIVHSVGATFSFGKGKERIPKEVPLEVRDDYITVVDSLPGEEAEKTRPVVNAITPIKKRTLSLAETDIPVIDEVTLLAIEITPYIEEVTPVAEETTPATEEVTPIAEETTPATEEVTPIAEETTPATEEVTPIAEESTPVIEEVTPIAEETTPVPEEQQLIPIPSVLENESTEGYEIPLKNSIYFDIDSDELTERAITFLDELAIELASKPTLKLSVVGHADASGNFRENMILSVKRAFNAKYYLVYEHKIQQSRIEAAGFGAEWPEADNSTEEGRRVNRRAEFKLIYEQGSNK